MTIKKYEFVISSIIEQSIEYVGCPYKCEVNVILTDNETIKEINNEQRQIDNETDVLSFPLVDYITPGDFSHLNINDAEYFNMQTGELLLGDIVISMDKVYEQAEAYNHSRTRELAFLVAHSMLHLFGYDHMEEEERKLMETKQEQILTMKGYTRDYEEI
ncbi:MAG: rRNA maturation RNase YbeY [Coprococcus sp.]